jgi:hypothetical protein
MILDLLGVGTGIARSMGHFMEDTLGRRRSGGVIDTRLDNLMYIQYIHEPLGL